MDSDQGKLFIGGISWETTEDKLKDYFGQFGDVMQAVIMRDKVTGRPRGFGFVVFSDPSSVDAVLLDKHTIDGRAVEAKRALSREEQQQTSVRGGNNSGIRSHGSSGSLRTKKIFVGGLPATLNEDGFRQYFENYGHVTDAVIMYDQNTQRPRGFGFISFDNEDSVDRVLHKTFHDLSGKQVEVKRAFPKDANPTMNTSGGGGGGGGGSIGGYNSSIGNASSYDGRMDSSRYMQNQAPSGAFPYGSSGYGYAPANSSMGYGGYSGYGAPGAAYANPNVANAGYASAAGARSMWNSQTPGYGAVGYGSTGQSAIAASGYGNQGYGYGSYGSSDGSYGSRSSSNPGGNASVGGDMQSAGYMGRGYSDASGGYGGGAWRSDSSQVGSGYGAQPNGSLGGYGSGGYGGGEARHAQQQ